MASIIEVWTDRYIVLLIVLHCACALFRVPGYGG